MNRKDQVIHSLAMLGVTLDDALTLRRAAMILDRWHEQECGDSNNYASWAIEWDDAGEVPYRAVYPHNGKAYRTRIRNTYTPARGRIEAIMARYPELVAYIQGDPRGPALRIMRKADMRGKPLDEIAPWAGVAVCK